MSELTEHYRVLLGLDAQWRVEEVDFSLLDKKVEIRVEHIGGLCCPECGAACPQADLAPERQWRHLDTMQFQTVIRAGQLEWEAGGPTDDPVRVYVTVLDPVVPSTPSPVSGQSMAGALEAFAAAGGPSGFGDPVE